MNKQKIAIALTSAAALALPILAFAVPGQIGSIESLVEVIERFVWVVFGLIVTISFIIAAVLFLTAGGDPDKVVKARTAFLWGVAGVVVGILAFSILKIIEGAIT